MKAQSIIDAVRLAIARELELDLSELRDDVSLRRFYHLDSVAAVNIIFHIEQLLQLEIDVAEFAHVDSVNDLKAAISKAISAQD